MSDVVTTARTGRLTILAAAYAAGFVALYVAAIGTSLGQLIDAGSLGVLGWLRSDAWLAFYDGRDVILYGILGAAAVAALGAIMERRIAPVVYAGLLVGLVAIASVLLKEFLPRPYYGDFAYADNTFPSGHTAITLAASIATIWCRPRWTSRVLVFVLGTLTSFVALASVLSFAHRASDSMGGVLIAGALSCGLAAIARVAVPPPSRVRRVTTIGSLVALGVALVYLVAALGVLGDGDHAAQLAIAIILGTLGGVVSVFAVHRPFPAGARGGRPSGGTAGQDEGL